MIVVDASVWIDFFRGASSREKEILKGALESFNRIALCGPVLQEVLQGIRDDREHKIQLLRFSKFPYLEATRRTWSRASSLYRGMRRRGFTLGAFDTIIAAVCLENNLPLLTSDRQGFLPLAHFAGLRRA